MPTIKVANFAFVTDGSGITLPTVSQKGSNTGTAGSEGYQARWQWNVDLPPDVRRRGILSMLIDTFRGDDNGVDVAFDVRVNAETVHKLSFSSDVYVGMQFQTTELKPGINTIEVQLTKGGTVKALDPDQVMGGKGKVAFREVSLLHHRDVVL